ncbi:MAG: UDP-N-acetylglucosamine diphosphorylase [Puniceicoccales bacterium]|jgi:NDP-sugar pyrophosphorylase family protein|nr:UDP-N-acetylglucosamine diphosphorylase [Puniceicoccales bacterium]
MLEAGQLFPSLGSLEFLRPFFSTTSQPWEWLPAIADALRAMPLHISSDCRRIGQVLIHPSASVDSSAHIVGPAFIGADCRIGPNALLRENVFCGNCCTVGHGSEIKNSLLLDGVTVPHRNYVGDSILGRGAHIGAGVVLANLRLDGLPVRVHGPSGSTATGLRKCGSFLGDGSQVGCNAVLLPGTVLGQGAWVHAAISFSGHLPDGCEAFLPQRPILRRRKSFEKPPLGADGWEADGPNLCNP